MLNDIPDGVLTGSDIKAALCHIGFRVAYEMTGTWLLARTGTDLIPLHKQNWGLLRSYIEQDVISNFGISKEKLLEGLNATWSSASVSGSAASIRKPQ